MFCHCFQDNGFFFVFFNSVVTYLADVEGIEEDSIEEVLEAKEHHLRIEGSITVTVLNMNSEAKQKIN